MMDIIGKRFGRLVVLEKVGSDKYGHVKVRALCDCGTIKVYYQQSLVSGATKSCGCYNSEIRALICKSRKKTNRYDLTSHDYGIGYTSNTNQEFYFDKEDFDKIKPYCWREDSSGYIVTNKGVGEILLLHRVVTNPESNMVVDHIGHNLKDNRKISLRVTTQSNNIKNQDMPRNNTSGVKGVYKETCKDGTEKWTAYVTVNRKHKSLGVFDNLEDAIIARKAGEEKYYGEYSYDKSVEYAEKNKIKD